jgi:hypothetical protein
MKANEAFEIIGHKLENDYGDLKFKYSKSRKLLKKSTKRFNYCVCFSSFAENIPDKDVGLSVDFFIQDKTLTSARSNVNDHLFFISLWELGNYYNVATVELLNNVYIDLKSKIEKYLMPFIEKLEEKINDHKEEWVEYGFLHNFNEFNFCTNLLFINSVYGRENAKKCLMNYLKTLDKNNQEIFKKCYIKYINGDHSLTYWPSFDDDINFTLFLDATELKLLE